MKPVDHLDLSVLRLLATQPRAGIREYARQMGVARATVQARIDRLQECGVLPSLRPQIAPEGLGFEVLAYVHLHLAQGKLDEATRRLATIPQILEADSIAGEGDLLCHVVARNNNDLETVIQHILATPGVIRSRTEVVLNKRIKPRVLPLLDLLRGTE
ncbi:AsnC family transcriptional regulator [Mycolicibacterium novocastrense]|uniref:Lrp/AsnC family transcriptional regulator n=1 Tax=Mycolicibacterium novocastrense TaxID=59813 RepID=UPI000746221F|nr:Lrp/AsnC family transcriptional regulator [Mycolicibacterium novocastrense]KUH67485.1 AsnC family transcriptional regulator [Mycolicibacterium novocastrense]KUH68205.1 AsnC family transcriptional regulator [Mycolicibacterium novocastrense]KUH74383.1 AsnC family transcriptional regulator [Mycolicibacterium novocastrense]